MRRLRIATLLALLGTCAQVQAGLFDDDEARRQIADQQIKTEARFDQQARTNLELSAQIQRQADEIARLRGQVETLSYELEQARKRQQDFYLDLDTRLRRLEPQTGGAPATTPATGDPSGGPVAAIAGDPSREYDAALGEFKAGKYKEAAAALSAFVGKYPEHALAPNAQFWLGNAWYAQRNCTKAIETQTVVTTRYASSDKAPDAWLAIATCQQELGNKAGASRSLQTLIDKYPAAPSADKARERLKKK